MAQITGFDATQENAFQCVPAGEYDLVVTKCDLKTTSGGNFQEVVIETKVLNGEFQNRVIFCHYMFAWIGSGQQSDGQKQALQIGRGRFGAICKAVNVPKPASTEELLGKTFTAKLKIRKSVDFGDRNEIASAKPRDPQKPVLAGEKGKW